MGWAEEATVQWVEAGPPAAAALARAVAIAKAGDPLAPVTVAVPSVYTGLGLRRSLARGGGIVNVRFLVLARVAELLGAPALAAAGRRPLTRARRAEAARRALLDDPGPFGEVASHPATVRSVERLAAELRRAGPAAVAALAGVDDHAAHLVRLARRAHSLTTHFYDDPDVFAAAARIVRAEGTAPGDIGHVVLFLPRRLHVGDQALLDALAEVGSLTVLLGQIGDPLGDEPTARLAPFTAGGRSAVDPPRGTSVVVAPDPDVEVRTVVRQLVARLHAGTPLHRMAVAYRSSRPYRLLLHEHLGTARVPYRGPATRTLAQTAAGRLLLGLLRLPAERFARTAVLDWLTCAPVLERPGGDLVPSLRWEGIARAANVVAGEAQWRDRLARYRWSVAHRLERRLAEGEDDAAGEGLRTELDHVDRLAAFVDELVRGATPPARPSWAAHTAWARGVLHRYLGGEGLRSRWPDDELEAARAVEAALDGLAELDDLSEPDAAAFAWVLEEQLRVGFGRQGRFGDGVFVGRVDDMVGLDLDVVFVLGLAEGAFPERHRPDGLLDDRARDAAGGALPTARARLAEQRRDYLWALAAARRERVLSFARADDRGRRERLPSRWLLETASHLAGRTLYADDLLSLPPAPWLHRIPSFAALPSDPPPDECAASAQELHLASLWSWTGAGGRLHEHPLVRREPALVRGIDARRARRAPGLSRWDGLVGPPAQEARVLERVQSATGLQWWATCPRRFFFERLLDVAETPTPEDELQLPPLEAGTLVHAALERFLAETPPRSSPDQPWSPAEREHLAAILDDVFADAERRGITGRPLLWRIQRRRLQRDVLGFLDRDEQARARDGVVPVAGELGFGLADGESPPVEVVTPAGRKLLFRGKIDRVDAAPDGSRLVVLDYKTGSPQRYTTLADDPVQGGRSLQLPLYALAARARFGDVPTEAAYWFVSDRADYRRFPVALDERTNTRFLAVLDAVADGIDAGVFPANPGKEDGRRRHAHCTICPYDAVCPRDRRQAWERVLDDPALEPYHRLGGAG